MMDNHLCRSLLKQKPGSSPLLQNRPQVCPSTYRPLPSTLLDGPQPQRRCPAEDTIPTTMVNNARVYYGYDAKAFGDRNQRLQLRCGGMIWWGSRVVSAKLPSLLVFSVRILPGVGAIRSRRRPHSVPLHYSRSFHLCWCSTPVLVCGAVHLIPSAGLQRFVYRVLQEPPPTAVMNHHRQQKRWIALLPLTGPDWGITSMSLSYWTKRLQHS
ncbi:hypothetical protein F4778DRAFT_682573 [Xylariomycetidae sp. FL2044]|nr:hypothetical protein F4778DRAFT_682573 [Xylariomycetidae sp. FL2044]